MPVSGRSGIESRYVWEWSLGFFVGRFWGWVCMWDWDMVCYGFRVCSFQGRVETFDLSFIEVKKQQDSRNTVNALRYSNERENHADKALAIMESSVRKAFLLRLTPLTSPHRHRTSLELFLYCSVSRFSGSPARFPRPDRDPVFVGSLPGDGPSCSSAQILPAR